MSDAATGRVTSLELFFDLVFVFAITQVAHLVHQAHGAPDYARAVLVLATVWWMYGGYAWLTNNVSTDRLSHRLLLLCAMAAFLVVALRIPTVSTQHGVAFGAAYLVIVLVHGALFTRAPNMSAHAIWSVLPFNLLLTALVLASGLVDPRWNLAPWVGAGLAIVATTAAARERDFAINPSHFVERHGLVILIALGESVVSIGTGAADIPLGIPLLAAAALGLALSACIWWTYFDADDVLAEHAMTRASGPERARLAIRAYYYAHYVMIVGIVTVAAGMADVIAGAARPTPPAAAWLLSAGVTIYLVGDVAFRSLLRIGPVVVRGVVALLVLLSAPLAARVGGTAQLGLVVVLFVGALALERAFGYDRKRTSAVATSLNASGVSTSAGRRPGIATAASDGPSDSSSSRAP
jgi:low temperature requirement protein LtrA